MKGTCKFVPINIFDGDNFSAGDICSAIFGLEKQPSFKAYFILEMVISFILLELPKDYHKMDYALEILNTLEYDIIHNNISADMLFINSDFSELRVFYACYNNFDISENLKAIRLLRQILKKLNFDSEYKEDNRFVVSCT